MLKNEKVKTLQPCMTLFIGQNLLFIEAAVSLFSLLSEVPVLLLSGRSQLSLDCLDLGTLRCNCIAERGQGWGLAMAFSADLMTKRRCLKKLILNNLIAKIITRFTVTFIAQAKGIIKSSKIIIL